MTFCNFRSIIHRAWSKILNFSDDQVGRPEKAAILWKWLIEKLRNSKKERKTVSKICPQLSFHELDCTFILVSVHVIGRFLTVLACATETMRRQEFRGLCQKLPRFRAI